MGHRGRFQATEPSGHGQGCTGPPVFELENAFSPYLRVGYAGRAGVSRAGIRPDPNAQIAVRGRGSLGRRVETADARAYTGGLEAGVYFLTVILSMFVGPVASILAETFLGREPAGIVPLIGKWFVFWGVGIRLFLAGLRQAVRPGFTAEKIFGLESAKPLVIVQELGFANLSLGLLGLLTIFEAAWVTPAAIAGGLFYGLAGFRHLFRPGRNRLENIALISDLVLFAVLAFYLAAAAGLLRA
jgi:hypothetical protein